MMIFNCKIQLADPVHRPSQAFSKTLGTDLVDKLADVEVESLSVEMIGETKTLGNTWLTS